LCITTESSSVGLQIVLAECFQHLCTSVTCCSLHGKQHGSVARVTRPTAAETSLIVFFGPDELAAAMESIVLGKVPP